MWVSVTERHNAGLRGCPIAFVYDITRHACPLKTSCASCELAWPACLMLLPMVARRSGMSRFAKIPADHIAHSGSVGLAEEAHCVGYSMLACCCSCKSQACTGAMSVTAAKSRSWRLVYAFSLEGEEPLSPPMMLMALILTAPLKGMVMSSSASSSLLSSVVAGSWRRSGQARNTCLALPAVASFRQAT